MHVLFALPQQLLTPRPACGARSFIEVLSVLREQRVRYLTWRGFTQAASRAHVSPQEAVLLAR